MSSDSIFSSVESEKRWVLEMQQNFPPQHNTTIDICFDTPTCVFKVPKTLSETKPEAYVPQYFGLGPYHHLRPDLYPARKQKLAAVREFLGENLHNVQKVVNAMIQFEPVVRACFDQYLDLDINTLAWILAIDGLYLLQFIENYSEMENLAGDILMLENQIPVVLLKKIQQVLQLPQVDFGGYDYLFQNFGDFCRANSPLKLNEQLVVWGDVSQFHLLHRMYYLIVNNRGIKEQKITKMSMYLMADSPISVDDVSIAVGFLAEQGVPGAAIAGQVLSLMEKVPWGRILGLFGKRNSDGGNVSSVEEIDIPSVSQMTEIAGIKFTLTPGGIRDIRFDEGEKKFYLPIITLNSTSEIVLRNLLAFEEVSAKPETTLEFAEYVDLMCGIVDTTKDVGILRKENIIVSELPDEEIARIFNGIAKSNRKINMKSNIEEAIDDLNKRFDNLVSVKVKRFLGKYAYASFQIICVVIIMAVFVLLTLNAFCSVFGCGRWFGKSAMIKSRELLWDQ